MTTTHSADVRMSEPFRDQHECVWSDNDIDALYEGLMFRSLQQLLNPHSSVRLRCDVNDWIFSDPLLGDRSTPRAFSFEATCRYLGVDPVEVRYQVLDLMCRAGVTDLIDENRMGVRDKRNTRSAPLLEGLLQLDFFEDDDDVFSPMELPGLSRRRAMRYVAVEPVQVVQGALF